MEYISVFHTARCFYAITNLLGSLCKKYGHRPERNIKQNNDQSIELIRNDSISLILAKIIDQIIPYLLESSDTCQTSKCTTKLISVQNPKISHAERQLCRVSLSRYATIRHKIGKDPHE
jgi:hypothetical protein